MIVGLATALAIAGVAVLPFLTPAWVVTGQRLTGADELSGFTIAQLEVIDQALLGDILFGPPDFDVTIDGQAVLAERERGHMRDVRGAFVGFFALALISLVVLIAAWRLRGRDPSFWIAIRRGSVGLVGLVAVGGLLAFVAFEVAFDVFHRLLFPPGSYTFDPRTDRLVQLFPLDFWTMSTIAVGAVILVLAVVVAWRAAGRARALTAEPAGTGGAAL
jgi:integral membrane protein (TIGR01906 family)